MVQLITKLVLCYLDVDYKVTRNLAMRRAVLIFVLILSAVPVFAHESSSGNVFVQGGVGLGTVIAVVISWSRNTSVLWAIVHGILGWLYVIYYAIALRR
jgi:hypothetical protein